VLTDFQPVNAIRDLAVLARLFDARSEVGVQQRDAALVAARDIDNLSGRDTIQLRRRRPKAVDVLAISSHSPCCFVGENFSIAN
jgi:hypothetical protein